VVTGKYLPGSSTTSPVGTPGVNTPTNLDTTDRVLAVFLVCQIISFKAQILQKYTTFEEPMGNAS